MARHLRRGLGGDLPAAMLGLAQNGRKAGLAVEARQAEPVDRSVPPDQRRGAAIADHGVILDPAHLSGSCLQGHRFLTNISPIAAASPNGTAAGLRPAMTEGELLPPTNRWGSRDRPSSPCTGRCR
jgi:hypothetical protein